MLALLGPNGAGKTTLIRAIAGRVRLDGGAVTLFGRDARARPIRGPSSAWCRRRSRSTRCSPRARTSRCSARCTALPRRALRERVRWALDWTGLAERAREPVKSFSGGMKRRLNLACGVLHEPKVVLLDEPTVGVDPQSREKIYEMLAGLRASGRLGAGDHALPRGGRGALRAHRDHGPRRALAEGTLAELVARGRPRGPPRAASRSTGPPTVAPAGFAREADGGALAATITDVAGELPALLARVRDAGLVVRDLDVRAASLQAVFLELTGKELRE